MRSAPHLASRLVFRFYSQITHRHRAISVTRRFLDRLRSADSSPRHSPERQQLASFLRRLRHYPTIRRS